MLVEASGDKVKELVAAMFGGCADRYDDAFSYRCYQNVDTPHGSVTHRL